MLFDLFYLNAWMKEGMLVWQPEWVNSIIAWVKTTPIPHHLILTGIYLP